MVADLTRAWANCFDATIEEVHGGYSSAAERLTVAQDVVGSIPTSRPKLHSPMSPWVVGLSEPP